MAYAAEPKKVPLWAVFVRDPAHGPLPALLLLLTVTTGIIDAVSILGLGRVFVANMTGNIVFSAFAIAGAPGFSLVASVAALAGFLIGAFFGGNLVASFGGHRGLLLRNACLIELVLVLIALGVAIPGPDDLATAIRIVVALLLAAAMGIQNTVARKLAVPDLTTTVLTMTLTGIAADARTSRRGTPTRRILAVLGMFAGAVLGALLAIHTRPAVALAPAALILAGVGLIALVRSRQPSPWQTHGVGS